MGTIGPPRQKTNIISGIPRLIELLHGFSIANGLAAAVPATMNALNSNVAMSAKLSSSLVLVLVFVLSIGEWLTYHIFIGPYAYQRFSLMLMDTIFPMLLFCIIVNPYLKFGCGYNVAHYSAVAVLFYFLVNFVYFRIAYMDNEESFDALFCSTLCLILSSLAFGLTYRIGWGKFGSAIDDLNSELKKSLDSIDDLFHPLNIVAVLIWSIFNLSILFRHFRSRR
jgi:hypothetical protein